MNSSPRPPSRPIPVLFVCLGNICRSPLAEGVFLALLEERGLSHDFEVDSAGTGSWHIGHPADPRSVAVARDHGVVLTGRARQTRAQDVHDFDWIIVMDQSNLRSLSRMKGSGAARLHLLREFDPASPPLVSPHEPERADVRDVPDPYYGGDDGFEVVYEIVERSCRGLLDQEASRAPRTT